VAALLYPIGFLIVILGRSQLYTENTVTPVAVVLTNFGALPNMLRLWIVIFVANVIGAILFAVTVVYGEVLPPPLSRSSSTRSPGSWIMGSGT
jgi:formate/nitrite transporter FocA (FNT family)